MSSYVAVGVRTVVIVERDTKAVEVFALAADSFGLEAPGPDGWPTIGALEAGLSFAKTRS